jgi:hypothetical protein
MDPLTFWIKQTANELLNKAKQKYSATDRALGGLLPGASALNPSSPLVRLVQQSANVIRNPLTQLSNPQAYRAWQGNLGAARPYPAGEYVPEIGAASHWGGIVHKNPVTGTYTQIPIISEGAPPENTVFNTNKPTFQFHFGGEEGPLSRAEARKEWLTSWKDRPEELFGPVDPAKEKAKGLAIRAQIGRSLDAIPPESWISTQAASSPQNVRARLYDRMTGGAFAVNPETGLIDVYKESPTTWRNIIDPEKVIHFDPREMIKPLEREALARPDINSLRSSVGGSAVDAITRRFGGPQVQALMLLDDVIKAVTGVSPTAAVLNATEAQLSRSVKEQQKQGVKYPQVWQNPPF